MPVVPTPARSPASLPTAFTPLASRAPTSLCDGSAAIIEINILPMRPAAPATIRLAIASSPYPLNGQDLTGSDPSPQQRRASRKQKCPARLRRALDASARNQALAAGSAAAGAAADAGSALPCAAL